MKSRVNRTIGIAVIVLCSLNTVAHSALSPSEKAKLKAIFQAKYNAKSLAFSQKSVDKYLSFVTSDYTFYDDDGKLAVNSKEEYRQKIVPYLATHAVKLGREPVADIQPTAGGMIVTIQRSNSGVTNRDFWVKVNGNWLIKQHRSVKG